jgi:hypothetical protein
MESMGPGFRRDSSFSRIVPGSNSDAANPRYRFRSAWGVGHLGFYLVARLAGRAVAEAAARAAEYDWHRDPQAPIFYPQQALVPVKEA